MMKQFFQICLVACLMQTSMVMAQNGFFLDVGASYNTVKFEQNYSASGVGTVTENMTVVASGEAGGPAAPFAETLDTLAPVLQAGYSGCFGCYNNFWGIKLGYQYLDLVSINRLTDTPQAGFLDEQNGSNLAFTGNVITKSAQSRITHNLDLLLFTGMSCRGVDLYLGAGPTLFRLKTNVYQAFGFANLNGLPREATGVPVSFSSSDWVWGSAIQLGGRYTFCPCWYLDVNYTYSVSAECRNCFSAPYTTTLIGGYTNEGSLFVTTKTKIRAQNLCFTIGRNF